MRRLARGARVAMSPGYDALHTLPMMRRNPAFSMRGAAQDARLATR
jgi:hypothetical protein